MEWCVEEIIMFWLFMFASSPMIYWLSGLDLLDWRCSQNRLFGGVIIYKSKLNFAMSKNLCNFESE